MFLALYQMKDIITGIFLVHGDLMAILLYGFKQILPSFSDLRILHVSWADFTHLAQ